jgi:hypothetical protein
MPAVSFRSGLVHPRYIVAAVFADVSLSDIVELAGAVARGVRWATGVLIVVMLEVDRYGPES